MTVSAVKHDLVALVGKARQAYAIQDMPTACAAIEEAAEQAPDHPAIAFMCAQFAYEAWFEAVPLFERAALLNPGNSDVVRNFTLALASEGQGERAERLLEGILARVPGWIEGHNTLSTMRVTAGQDDPYRSFAEATVRETNNAGLYQAWFHRLVTAKDWEAAGRVVALGEKHLPAAIPLLQLYLDCESGRAGADPSIFETFAKSSDPGLALLQIRHALRHGDPARALRLAEEQLGEPHEGQFWPYCSLCWRLLEDPKVHWLDGSPKFAATVDLGFNDEQLGELADFLRNLHKMSEPYPEQSVRGGTQTDRNLLLHHDPVIQNLRQAIVAAVEAWRDGLPDDTTHPLLSRKPENILFSGSWSVRLTEGGHHSAHTHPQGWASSALYVVVPSAADEDHAGQLALGMPPSELGLGLDPDRYLKPKPGRLALFPSTTWHGTIPFKGEERMTVAFDVAPNGWGAGF